MPNPNFIRDYSVPMVIGPDDQFPIQPAGPRTTDYVAPTMQEHWIAGMNGAYDGVNRNTGQGGGVWTFNNRAGTVTLDSADIVSAGGALAGGIFNFISTGSSAMRSVQDRFGTPDAHLVNARDFGCACDGVTDDGAALNVALASVPPGTVMWIPASLFTTQTIVVRDGRRLEMPPGTLVRPVPDDHATWLPTHAIIGSATLSPVVLVWSSASPEGGLTNVQIWRNGTPASGEIGLQCIGSNQTYSRVYSWNHGIGIQCGALQAVPVMGQFVAITCAFDHCKIWQCYEHFLYLVNAPEMSFYDPRFGIDGGVDPAGATSLITIDGDNNATAGGTNTLTVLRGQFNTGGNPLYSVQFTNVLDQGVYKFIGCYSGGATTAFCYVNPSCTFVQGITFMSCTFDPLHAGETFWLDTGAKSNGTKIIGCEFGPVTPASFFMSGIGATIIGNTWFGGSVVQLDAMTAGCCIGNSANTFTFTGAYTTNFTVSGNSYTNLHDDCTGPVVFVEQNVTNVGPLSIISPVDNNPIQFAAPSGSVDSFLHLMSGDTSAPHSVWDTPFLIGTTGGLTAVPGGQSAATQIVSQITFIGANGNIGNGVKLPASTSGYWQVVTNATTLSAQVYGSGTDTINGNSTGTGVAVAAGKTLLVFCYAAGSWFGGVLG